MAKFGKKYQDAAKLVEAGKAYDLAEAIEVVKKTATAKFDESVDVAVRLGVNPKYADQQVRGAVVLPHGTGKSKRVLVFAKGDKVAEAEAAGADFVGSDELVAKIKEGWCDFDVTAERGGNRKPIKLLKAGPSLFSHTALYLRTSSSALSCSSLVSLFLAALTLS